MTYKQEVQLNTGTVCLKSLLDTLKTQWLISSLVTTNLKKKQDRGAPVPGSSIQKDGKDRKEKDRVETRDEKNKKETTAEWRDQKWEAKEKEEKKEKKGEGGQRQYNRIYI